MAEPTAKQVNWAKVLIKRAGYTDPDEAVRECLPWAGPVAFEDLTRAQVSRLIDKLRPGPEVRLVTVHTPELPHVEIPGNDDDDDDDVVPF